MPATTQCHLSLQAPWAVARRHGRTELFRELCVWLCGGAMASGVVGCQPGATIPVPSPEAQATAPATTVSDAALSLNEPAGRPTSASALTFNAIGGAPAAGEPVTGAEESADAKIRATFQRLVAAMSDADPNAWSTAEAELRAWGGQAVPVLAEELAVTDVAGRELAAMFLASLGPEAQGAADALRGVLTDESALVRVNAAAALANLVEPEPGAERVLVELLSEADPVVQTTAVAALGNLAAPTHPQTVQVVARLLEAADPTVQTTALNTLARWGEQARTALPDVESLATSATPEVREAALLAAQTIRGERPATSEAVPASATE